MQGGDEKERGWNEYYSRNCIKRSPFIKQSVVKSRKLHPLITVILTSVKRSRSPLLIPNVLLLLSGPVLDSSFIKENHSSVVTNSLPGT